MQHATNEFKNCPLSQNYMKQAKTMMFSFGVALVGLVIAFAQHY